MSVVVQRGSDHPFAWRLAVDVVSDVYMQVALGTVVEPT